MVDVKIHKAFPTTIYQFEYHPSIDDYANMEMHISETRKNYKYHTDDDLHQQLHFIKLREKIYDVAKQYLNNLEYEHDVTVNLVFSLCFTQYKMQIKITCQY